MSQVSFFTGGFGHPSHSFPSLTSAHLKLAHTQLKHPLTRIGQELCPVLLLVTPNLPAIEWQEKGSNRFHLYRRCLDSSRNPHDA